MTNCTRINCNWYAKLLTAKCRPIVIAPANTGNDNKRRNAVINTAHTKRGKWWNDIPLARILKIVQIKLIAPKIEEAPERCKLKILGIDEFSLTEIDIKFDIDFNYEKAPPQN